MHDSPKPRREKALVFSLLKRVAQVFLVASLASLYFWVVGGFRGFLDETQESILVVLRYSSVCLMVASAVGVVGVVVRAFLERRAPRILAFLGYFLMIAYGLLAVVVAESLAVLGGGL